MERESNPFKSDDTARVILGSLQVFTFAIAIMLLLAVSA